MDKVCRVTKHQDTPKELFSISVRTVFELPFESRLEFAVLSFSFFSYLAPKLWNNLPNIVKEADSVSSNLD